MDDRKMPAKNVRRDDSDDERKEQEGDHEDAIPVDNNTSNDYEEESQKEKSDCRGSQSNSAAASNDAPDRAEEGSASNAPGTRDINEAEWGVVAPDHCARLSCGFARALPALDAVKEDDMALRLVERMGTPGAYRVAGPLLGGIRNNRPATRTAGLSPQPQQVQEEVATPQIGPPSYDDAIANSDDAVTVLDAHVVAPHRSEEESAVFLTQIREQLVRNAPLVEGTVMAVEDLDGGSELNEESGSDVSVGDVPCEHARPGIGHFSSSSLSLLIRGQSSSSGLVAVHTRKDPCPWYSRCCTLRALVLLGAALVLVISLSIPLSRRRKERSTNPFSNGGGTPASFMPSSAPSSFPTAVPTPDATTERFVSLHKSLLLHASLTKPSDLSDPRTPQWRALEWLAEEDPANVAVGTSVNDAEELVQRYVAAVFFFSTADTVEYPSSSLSKIMVGHECNWNIPSDEFLFLGKPVGIACAPGSLKIETIQFGLEFRPLAGTFPREIGHLSHLRYAIVRLNQDLVGTIPDSMLSLQELRAVFFNSNGLLGGTIPSFTAPNLRTLAITGSPFHGTIPKSIGNLTKLVNLHLSDLGGENPGFNGTVPELVADLKELVALSISGNDLSGSLPPSLGEKQNSLAIVNFAHSKINGTIPNGLLNRTNLKALFLQGNRLSGTIASQFGLMADLKMLSLHSNLLTSTIPPELGSSVSLEYLELGDNLLNGTVPPNIGNLDQLEFFSLAGNVGLIGDLNFICEMSGVNLLADCSMANDNLQCDCCVCCHGSSRTCGQYPDSTESYFTFFQSECCLKNQCGVIDCDLDNY